MEAYQANVALAEAVLKQSENQKSAGTGTGIEVTRAKVQLSNEKQHLLAVQNERSKSYLQLLRVMGLNLATELELTDKLSYEPTDADHRGAGQSGSSEKPSRSQGAGGTRSRRPPECQFRQIRAASQPGTPMRTTAPPGTNGNIVSLLPTRDYGFALRVPIFDGGRRDARRAEVASQFRQERVRTNDLHEQIELDIRTALDSLHSAEEQLKVAEEGLTLSDSELTQARRRFEAGFASNLEVTDAQTRLERARDNRIDALFGYNVARIDLGRAMGNVRRMIQ